MTGPHITGTEYDVSDGVQHEDAQRAGVAGLLASASRDGGS